jgi:hypothetical protein
MVVYSLAALAETLSADGGGSPGHLA